MFDNPSQNDYRSKLLIKVFLTKLMVEELKYRKSRAEISAIIYGYV